MRILVVGNGGREATIVWSLAKSKQKPEIFCAPGNAGTTQMATNLNIEAEDLDGLVKWAKKNQPDLTVIGPEGPLVKGVVDLFKAQGLLILGPSQIAASLEGSKSFAKEVMVKADIPTAKYKIFNSAKNAIYYINNSPEGKLVIKADGLAAGKGVIMCENRPTALKAVDDFMVKKIHGEAGNKIVIEEWLEGEEASFIALTDGKNLLPLASSQDHKKLEEGDRGPNTGGMGAYSPAPVVTEKMHQKIVNEIMIPLIKTMKKMGAPYQGVIYVGLIISRGQPKVLEFNVRFGDPEIQAILPRLKDDILEIFMATVNSELANKTLSWYDCPAVCVVLASQNYPENSEKGLEIKGIKNAEKLGAIVFHAGTKEKDGKIITCGGRVLGITALGNNLQDAVNNAYDAVEEISWPGMKYRTDIAYRAL